MMLTADMPDLRVSRAVRTDTGALSCRAGSALPTGNAPIWLASSASIAPSGPVCAVGVDVPGLVSLPVLLMDGLTL